MNRQRYEVSFAPVRPFHQSQANRRTVYNISDCPLLLHPDYTINDAKLQIRCGILFRMDLPISKITEITHKSTILSSSALSAKRIGLKYGKKNWVYLSLKNQEDFISSLKSINPMLKIC